jgi:SulP family sulfate permease
LLGVTVLDTLPGLFIGIAASLLLLVYRASRPFVATLGKTPGPDGHYRDTDRHPDARTPDGVAVLRVESGLFFANADAVRARILHAAADGGIHAVVLDAETIPFIDVSVARMLTALDQDLRARGVRLLIARDVGQFRDGLTHATETELGQRYATIDAAVTAATEPQREDAG